LRKAEALEVLQSVPLDEVRNMCAAGRSAFGRTVDLCAIMNARNGGCRENCGFCAQSGVPGGIMEDADTLNSVHRRASATGIGRFSIVTSGGKVGTKELDTVCQAASMGNGLSPLCASLGLLELDELKQLKDAGFTRYHHNLETSERYFPSVCITHSWEQRVSTVEAASRAGLSVCSGGIMGIGESDEDRVDLALALAELPVSSIALNFYVPVDGARISEEYLSPEKRLRITAMFFLVNPVREVRICAGRKGFGDMEGMVFDFGATGIMTGDLLTTAGSSLEDDRRLIEEAGYRHGIS